VSKEPSSPTKLEKNHKPLFRQEKEEPKMKKHILSILCLFFVVFLFGAQIDLFAQTEAPGTESPGTGSAVTGATKGEPPSSEAIYEQALNLRKLDSADDEKLDKSEIEKALSGMFPTSLSRNLRQYGYDFFNKDISTFTPVGNVPVGGDYVVGPGDSFTIHLWGKAEGRYEVTVSRDGTINLPRLGNLSVSGFKYDELNSYLFNSFKEFYPDFEMSITMDRLRTITIFVIGEAANPGTYSVSSLSTVISALVAAGGPGKNGSMRNVQVLRQGEAVKELDLYKFFLNGEKENDIRLQNNDTVFIPVIGPVAGIAGHVRRPAIYEMKESQTIGDIVEFAGGILPVSHLQNVTVERVVNNERRVIRSFDLDISGDGGAENMGTLLGDFDVIKIYPLYDRVQQVVYLQGHVKYPREYEFKPGMKLSDLISSYDDLLPMPYQDRAEIIRMMPPDLHPELIEFDLGGLLKGDRTQDMPLQELDSVIIYSLIEKSVEPKVVVEGAVKKPGSYLYYEGMTVKDLIFKAGNLTQFAYLDRAEIQRLVPPDLHPELITFDLGTLLAGNSDKDLELQNLDQVVIHSVQEMVEISTVTINGAVKNPGTYTLYAGMTVKDLIFQAGNMTQVAYQDRADLTRIVTDQDTTDSIMLTFSPESAVSGIVEDNFVLQKDDVIHIREIPMYREALNRKIDLQGEFVFPGEYTFSEGERLFSIIERAGGFTDTAYPLGAVFQRESAKNLQKEQLKDYVDKLEQDILSMSVQQSEKALDEEEAAILQSTLGTKKALLEKLRSVEPTGRMVIDLHDVMAGSSSIYNFELRAGDRLIVEKRPDFVTVIGEVYNPTSLFCEHEQDVDYYLNLVGGITDYADRGQIYVVKADGSVFSKSQSGFMGIGNWNPRKRRWTLGGFGSMELDPGDTIIVPKKVEDYPWLRVSKDMIDVVYKIAISAAVLRTF
jgi:protein involved in polysaccharide export with SLBB domain